jgi:predicted MFS family arabinose efflux permease
MGLLIPVYVSSAVAGLNALFVWITLPEPTRHVKAEHPPGTWLVAGKVRVLLAVGFVTTLASVSMEQTIAFYFQDRLALTPKGAARAVGLSLVLYGLVSVLVQGVIVRRIHAKPLQLLRFGVPIAALGLVLLAAAEWRSMLVVAMALQGVGQALAMPGVTAALSLSVKDDEQGAVAGLNSSCQALARTAGPLLGTGLYEIDPGYPYLFGAALLFLVLLFVWTSRSPSLRTS